MLLYYFLNDCVILYFWLLRKSLLFFQRIMHIKTFVSFLNINPSLMNKILCSIIYLNKVIFSICSRYQVNSALCVPQSTSSYPVTPMFRHRNYYKDQLTEQKRGNKSYVTNNFIHFLYSCIDDSAFFPDVHKS